MAKLQPVRGTRDILGEDARRFAAVVDAFRRVADGFNFSEIATPVFEFSDVFRKTLGDVSDVVSKEMYSFEDRGGEEITLRPEFTAGIARAYLSGGLQQHGVCKFYAYGPMFRYERPQKGRYRQFHQLDVEIIGAAEPGADIDVIAVGQELLVALGIADQVTLHLNSLGGPEDRAGYRDALVGYFRQHEERLSDDSRERLNRNPLRILDSKDAGDREIVQEAPRFSEFLSADSRDFFARVRAGLENLGIGYQIDETLVRGLDYYTHTAFEFITDALGAQGTVIGGGRYDGLIEAMGGPPTPGVGWAAGIERLAMLLPEPDAPVRPIAIVPLGEAAEAKALCLASELRAAGLKVDLAYRGNMRRRLQQANRIDASHAIILGDDELSRGVAQVKDLDSGDQRECPLDRLAPELRGGAGND